MAYTFRKSTVILGYTTPDANPFSRKAIGRDLTADEAMACNAWMDAHIKTYSLNGHWSAEAIRNFAARRNLHNVSARHHESNVSKPGVLNSKKDVAL